MNTIKLSKPTIEDQRKIHAEVNQLINSVSLLNIAAIAITGTVLSSVFSKSGSLDPLRAVATAGSQSQIFAPSTYAPLASLALLAILGTILAVGFGYFKTIRFLTSYLIYTKSSVWESHFFSYYKNYGKPRFLYSETRAWLFLILGIIAYSAPWFVFGALDLKSWMSLPFWWPLTCAFVIYIISVFFIGFKTDLILNQDLDILRWKELFNGEDLDAHTP